MSGLPKYIIKKYGISKKAWQVYRSKKKKTKRSHAHKKIKRRSVRVARRRKSRRISYRRSKFNKEIGIVAYATIGEPLIDSLASRFSMGLPADAVKVLLGYFLKKKGGMIGGIGTAMYYISLYGLSKQLLSGGLNLSGILQPQATAESW